MEAWNILATSRRRQERYLLRVLKDLGDFRHSGYRDVILGHVTDVPVFLAALESIRRATPEALHPLGQVVPLERNFRFEVADFVDKGFEVARKGTNGFHAFVARTGDDAFRGSWPLTGYRDDILYPISFDSAGAKEQMRVFFDAAEMQAKGTHPGELKKIIKERFRTGYYKAPERAGISYMLSPILRTYWNPEENDSVVTINYPHVMYYAPNVSDEDIGGGKRGGFYPFVIMPGPHGYFIQPIDLTERAAINKQYEELLARLCSIKKAWCLSEAKGRY